MTFLDDAKNWWENLLDRERRMLTIGVIVLSVLVIYALIWSPLSDAVTDYKTQIESQRTLLIYLKKAEAKIASMKAQGIQPATTSDNVLSLAEQTLSQQALSVYLKQVQQPKPNQVALTFEKVPFDKLMSWLQMLIMQHGVSVLKMQATRLPVIGSATVVITLQLA